MCPTRAELDLCNFLRCRNAPSAGDVAPSATGRRDMQHTKHRNAAADTTGWLLGTIIVVLAVLDLLIWATLWNVPNPVSKWLLPQAVANGAASPASYTGHDDGAQHAMLRTA